MDRNKITWTPDNIEVPTPKQRNNSSNPFVFQQPDMKQDYGLEQASKDNFNAQLGLIRDQITADKEASNQLLKLYGDKLQHMTDMQGLQGLANLMGLAMMARNLKGVDQNNSIPSNYPYPTGTTPTSGDIWYLVHKNESGGDYGAETNLPGEFSIGRRQSNVLDGGLDYIYNYVLAHKDSIKGADQFINAFSPLRVNGSFINADRNAISKAHKAAVAGGYWQGAEDAATQYKYFDEPMSRLNPEVRNWINSALPLQQFFASRSVQTGQGAIANRLNALYKKHGGNTAKILDEFYSPEYNDTVIFKPTNKFRVNKPQAYWSMTRGPKGRFVSERSYLRNLGY